MRIVYPHDGTAGPEKGGFIAGITAYIGPRRAVLQTYPTGAAEAFREWVSRPISFLG